MAGNRAIYNQAINEGNSAAWEQQWDKAIAAYARALDEFPDDSSVMSSLGLALLAQNRWEQALAVYQRAAQLNPHDPLPLEKCGEIFERMSKNNEAAQAYYMAAESFITKRDINKAIENWGRAALLNPDHFQAHSRLALANERVGKNTEASNGYVQVARLLQKQGDLQKALQAAQRAAQLDPRNSPALQAIDLIQRGASLPTPERPRGGTGVLRLPPTAAFSRLDVFAKSASSTRPLSDKKSNPLEDGRRQALERLADLMFEIGEESDAEVGRPKKGGTDPFKNVRSGNKLQLISSLTQGIDLQSKGDSRAAIPFFEKAVKAGMEHAALDLVLGTAYFDGERYKEAVKYFQSAAQHPGYAAGAFFGAGVCYGREGKMKEAIGYLLRSLQAVDQTTVPEAQVASLAALYDTFQENVGRGQTPEQLTQAGETLVGFLSGMGWRERVQQARRQLNAQQENGALAPLAEMLSIPGADRVMESMSLIEKYMARKLWVTALDEAQRAVEYSPTYLPVHMKMGEILALENRTEAALTKFTVAAELYHARGEASRGTQIYQQIAQLAPMDLNIRAKLAQLFIAEGRILDAIRYTVEAADIHLSLADFNMARQVYNSALLLAQKPDIDKAVAGQIMHKIGDLDMQRLDWRQALKTYEQIKAQNPADEKARLALISLYLRLGQPQLGLRETDELLKQLLLQRNLPKAIKAMETLVNENGAELAFRQRLIHLYQQAGRKAEAIAQLDTLADMYHQAGNKVEAIKTLQAIIALAPNNIDEYRQVLAQLQSSP